MTTRAGTARAKLAAASLPPSQKNKKNSPVSNPKSAKPNTAKPKTYGRAIFQHKAKGTRKHEATAKENREKKMVASPFRAEVPIRIKLLRGLKKMIQKIVTGAEAKTCPLNKNTGKPRTKCAVEEMVKGPYLVSLSSVQLLADIIKLTPHDGSGGKRKNKLVEKREKFVELKQKRKQLIKELFEKKEHSRPSFLNKIAMTDGSREIAVKAMLRKVAAANAKAFKKSNKINRLNSIADNVSNTAPEIELDNDYND